MKTKTTTSVSIVLFLVFLLTGNLVSYAKNRVVADEEATTTDRILVDEAGWSFRVLDGSEKLARWQQLYPWAFQGEKHYAELTGCPDNAGGSVVDVILPIKVEAEGASYFVVDIASGALEGMKADELTLPYGLIELRADALRGCQFEALVCMHLLRSIDAEVFYPERPLSALTMLPIEPPVVVNGPIKPECIGALFLLRLSEWAYRLNADYKDASSYWFETPYQPAPFTVDGITYDANQRYVGFVINISEEAVKDGTITIPATVYNPELKENVRVQMIAMSLTQKNPVEAERLVVEEGVGMIEPGCFSSWGFKEVVLPSTLRYFGADAFGSMTRLESVAVGASAGELPVLAAPDAFDASASSAKLLVSEGSTVLDRSVAPWSFFGSSGPMASVVAPEADAPRMSAADGVLTVEAASGTLIRVFSTDGRLAASGSGRVSAPLQPGLYLVTTADWNGKIMVR